VFIKGASSHAEHLHAASKAPMHHAVLTNGSNHILISAGDPPLKYA